MIPQWLKRMVRKTKVYLGGVQTPEFPGSERYWENRYKSGGNSGAGSYGRLAHFKADFLNSFVKERSIRSVTEFGCGDGHQLSLANYPSYIGLDVSAKAMDLCQRRFAGDSSKQFFLNRPGLEFDLHGPFSSDLTLSLDVIYHLIEDEIFETYMRHLFQCAQRHVIVYSSNVDEYTGDPHVRHRLFTAWVSRNQKASRWHLEKKVANPFPFDPTSPIETSFADFFVFTKV